MKGFLGSYLHKIDEKGRLGLPAPFRRESGGQTLVLVHVFPDCLTLYPESAWEEDVDPKLRVAMRGSRAERAWALRVSANALEVDLDKQGRILVPQRMQDAVGLKGPTLVVGALNKIELWDPERFDAATRAGEQAESVTLEIFG
jgi:MraZ protein